jgi:solute carrier family 35
MEAASPLYACLTSACAGVLVGAVMYTYNDIFFSPKGYIWVGIWYALCVVDSVVMKHVADTVPMTTWSRTYYNVRTHVPPTAC